MFRITLLLVLMLAVVLPTFAQDDEVVAVDYENIHFSYDPSIASDVIIEEVEAVPLEEGMPEWAANPAFTQFSFEGYGAEKQFYQIPSIRFYNAADFEAFAPEGVDPQYTSLGQIARLQELLAEEVDLAELATMPATSGEEWLPFIPVANAAQVFRAQPTYVEFEGGKGIRYLTYYSQAVNPITDLEIFYTFQGITDDGETYISATLPLSTGLFPEEIDFETFDYDAFVETYNTFLEESLAALNEQAGENFTPSLDALDAMIASIHLDE